MNSIFDTESKIIHFMGSNKYNLQKNKVLACFQTRPNIPKAVRVDLIFVGFSDICC